MENWTDEFVGRPGGSRSSEEPRRIVSEGHEVGLHGWIHERNSVLSYETERELMLRSADTLEYLTGTRPVGIRTPSWDFSAHTLRIEQEPDLRYDSSLMAGEDCYELRSNGIGNRVM
jgi:peptidoglycan/xylan/chitin deacetylase (PgdA/CDA1 family)